MLGQRKTKRELLAHAPNDQTSAKTWYGNGIRYETPNGRKYQYHETIIVEQSADQIRLNTGGWYTSTTKQRINEALSELQIPYRIYQKRGQWYVYNQTKTVPFYDGITIGPNGPDDNGQSDHDRRKRLSTLITNFVRYARKQLETKPLPLPNQGDCLYCSLSEVKTGKSLTEVTKNSDCLISHCEEKYLHGSLIYRAVKARRPCPEVVLMTNENGFARMTDLIVADLRHYLKRQILGS